MAMSIEFLNMMVKWDRGSRQFNKWSLIDIDTANNSPIEFSFKKLAKQKLSLKACVKSLDVVKLIMDKFPDCMVVAGGFFNANCKCLTDIDIFFYGISATKMEEIIKYAVKDYQVDYITKFHRNKNMVSVSYFCEKVRKIVDIQFILRLYKSKDLIIGGFDLGASAVMYDGTDYLFTPMGAICNMYRINIIDTTHNSSTYVYRLEKYNKQKKFGVVALELNHDIGDPKMKKNTSIINKLEYDHETLGVRFVSYEEQFIDGKKITAESNANEGLSNYSIPKNGYNYIEYVYHKDIISEKILANMHMMAKTYEGLFTCPVYFSKEHADYRIKPYWAVSSKSIRQIYTLFSKDIGNTYVRMLCDYHEKCITEDDKVTMDTIAEMKINEIMAKHDELIAVMNTPLAPIIVDGVIPSDMPITAKEWYGKNYKDVGLDTEFASEEEYDAFNAKCLKMVFGIESTFSMGSLLASLPSVTPSTSVSTSSVTSSIR